MKVALFSDAVPPRIDGVAITVSRLARELADRGHEVALAGPGSFGAIDAVTLHLRLPAVDLPRLPGLRGSPPWLGRAARRLDAFAPDLVHSLTEMPVGLAGRRYAHQRGIPFVTSAHTDYPAYLARWGVGAAAPLMRGWMTWFHRASTVTMCPSKSHETTLRSGGHGGRCTIWSRGVDAERFSPAHRSMDVRRRYAPNGEKIILTVGRVVPEKRIEYLIDAFASRSYDPRCVLLVVGDGASRAALSRRSTPNVVFAGSLEGRALSAAYASSDLFAVASCEETFGNAVLEAMASGLPILAPRAGALPELVDESSGVLVPPALSPSDFGRELARMMSSANETRRAELGVGARRQALRRTWAGATNEVLASYALALRGA